MHELSLAEGIVQLIEEAASRERFRRVASVRLEIGRLAAVECDALRFCFDSVTRDTVAAGARLDIDEAPGEGWCRQCCATVPVDESPAVCPRCGGLEVRITGGTQMRVKDLEVE